MPPICYSYFFKYSSTVYCMFHTINKVPFILHILSLYRYYCLYLAIKMFCNLLFWLLYWYCYELCLHLFKYGDSYRNCRNILDSYKKIYIKKK